MVGLSNKYPKQLLNSAVHKVLFSDSTEVSQLLAGYYPFPKRILKAIEGKKHRTPLKKKFDIGMNEIYYKIGIAVKRGCQVTISALL
jgi:hypothetical protein